jgi:hypothetical protein
VSPLTSPRQASFYLQPYQVGWHTQTLGEPVGIFLEVISPFGPGRLSSLLSEDI